jgi:hypothetical protein
MVRNLHTEGDCKVTATPLIEIVTGPKNARTSPDGLRFYTWQGRDLPSVTSARRMAGLPHGLHQWSITKVVDRAIDNVMELAARLTTSDPSAIAMARTWLRQGATEERDKAATLGTAVHDAAATGKSLTEVSPEIAPRLRQYLEWLAVSGAEILGAEFQCWNLTVGYAGTADLLVRFPNGSVWVIDLKTGKGVYGEHALQLMAYFRAEFVGTDDVVDDRLTGLLRQATGMAVLHLADDHWEFRAMRGDAETWRAFRGLVAFAEWMHIHGSADTVTLGKKRSA